MGGIPEPIADRPQIPAGYLEDKRLPWSWAEKRLARSRSYWLSTVTHAGKPHSRPFWGIWWERRLYFSSGSRIREHIERSPEISLHLESADECVIVEGTVAPELNVARTASVVDEYNRKYGWDMQAKPGEFYALTPRVAFAWVCDGSGEDGGALFQLSATRWKFAPH
jgi:hypothetical protein